MRGRAEWRARSPIGQPEGRTRAHTTADAEEHGYHGFDVRLRLGYPSGVGRLRR